MAKVKVDSEVLDKLSRDSLRLQDAKRILERIKDMASESAHIDNGYAKIAELIRNWQNN